MGNFNHRWTWRGQAATKGARTALSARFYPNAGVSRTRLSALLENLCTTRRGHVIALQRWENSAINESGLKAAVNAPQSKRFAQCEDAQSSRQRLDCGGFGPALTTGKADSIVSRLCDFASNDFLLNFSA